jgi:4-amino-4-deoxy-L-arabinose transferase-like glycosyltransferase
MSWGRACTARHTTCLLVEATDVSARQAGWLLTALLVVSAGLRITLNGYVPSPFIFADELLYVEHARGFFDGHRMLFSGRDTRYPNWLYPVLIAPMIAGWPMAQAHRAILALNAIVGSLTVLPAYFWARELVGRREALAAAALVALLPGLGYSGVVMTECLFLAVTTLTLWLTYRAILRPTFERCLLAGLVAGLSFHVKPQALVVPFTIAGTVVWFESERLRRGRVATRETWAGLVAALGRHWVTALGWGLGMAPRLLEVAWLERPGEPVTVNALLGNYAGTAIGARPVSAAGFALSLAGYCAGWTLCTGVWPSWRLVRELRASLRLRNDRATRLMSQLTTVATLTLLALSARHTVSSDDLWRLHERYFFVVLPPVLILLAARARADAGGRRRMMLRFVSLLALASITAWIAYVTRWSILTDSPTFAGLVTVVMFDQFVRKTFALMFWVVGAATTVAALFAGRGGVSSVHAVALMFVAFNLGWYGGQDQLTRHFVRDGQALARKVGDKLGRDDKLLVLLDGLTLDTVWHARFRNAGLLVHLDPTRPPWWSSPIMLGADLRVLSPYQQERSWLLASSRWKFNKQPVQLVQNTALYALSGEPPLRFDPAQPLPPSVRPMTDLEAARRRDLTNLRLTVLEHNIPERWQAGRASAVRLRLRNDSLFSLPVDRDWRAGYHWARPGDPGGGTAAVWDDDHNAPLPKQVPTGEEFVLYLNVLAPPTPGAGWWLTVRPFETVDGRREWSDTRILDFAASMVKPSTR